MDVFDEQAQLLSDQLEHELEEAQLVFPTALEVSLRIKRLVDDPDSTLEQIANAVQAEPVLAAKTIKLANSTLLNPAGQRVGSLTEAVRRVGLSTLRSLAFTVAAEQLAQDKRSPTLRTLGNGLWMNTVEVASWSHAIARQLHIVPPDRALLAGMMINIGQFLMLARATDFPALTDDIKRLAEFVLLWDEPLGRAVLEVFEMPDDLLDTFEYEDPFGGSWPPADLRDIVFIASLAAETPNPFEALLGNDTRAQLFESVANCIGRENIDALFAAAAESRKQLLSALID